MHLVQHSVAASGGSTDSIWLVDGSQNDSHFEHDTRVFLIRITFTIAVFKYIGSQLQAGTGYNNIDLDACREKGIAICNVPEYTTEAMGDYAITLVMALSCSLAPQMKALAKGDRTYMHQCHLGHLDHFEIRGKTYGIIGGLGYIATNISKKALGLGMRVIVSDMPSTPLGMRDTGVEVVTFDDLLKQSDFISPMVPLNKHTKGLLNAECFDKMKPTAYVINTARGPIVDQAAIVDALRKKKIAGAALDVFGEGSAPPPPLPDDSPLYDA